MSSITPEDATEIASGFAVLLTQLDNVEKRVRILESKMGRVESTLKEEEADDD